MAASLSRPDPSSPASVAEAGFTTSRRGFNQGEVRAFLTSVAAELGRLQERQRQLEAELHTARSVPPASVELDDETVASLLGEETLRVLHTARESASEIKIRAEDNAARILREANDEANRIRQETEVEVARRRYDASADAEAEVALAKQQGREMVNEARAYRERVLADLERRTTLARKQIEELVHGRDRLLQVFERARLVAVDVTSELQAIDGPEQLVNLSPTTGPVPIMVPTDSVPEQDVHDSGTTAADATPGEPADTELVDLVDAAGPADVDQADQDDDPGDVDDLVEPERAVDDEAAADDDDDADDDDEGPADAADDTSVTGAARDANVVSLFRGRAAPDDSDEAGVAGDQAEVEADRADQVADDTVDSSDPAEVADDTVDCSDPAEAVDGVTEQDRPDVGGIFARLRSESDDSDPTIEKSGAEQTAHESAADEGTDVEQPPADDTDRDIDEPTPFSRRDAALVPLIVGAARKIKRALADEQNGVLDTLRQTEPVTELDGVLPDLDDHVAIYVAALEEDLTGAAAAGAGELGINDTKTLRRKLGRTGALDSAHDLVRSDLLRPLRDRLERAVADGAGDNEQITKRVRAVYREWKTQHIDDQLDDVFRFAHGGGLAVSTEPGTPVIWAIDTEHPACPDCEDNSLAGAVAAGDAFPTGHTAAPAHPGCRCLTLPADQ